VDTWIELARGPLFRIALAALLIGLAYRLGSAASQVILAWRRAGDRQLPLRSVVTATLSWLLPVRLLRQRPLYGIASLLFHVSIIALPLFLAGHVVLVQPSLPFAWPRLPGGVADTLSVVAFLALGAVLVGRLAVRTARVLTRFQDVAVLALLLFLVGFGFLAAHPALSPFPARTMLLLHILAGDLALALTPVTKIAHCIVYPFTQLIFELAWHFPADSGRHVVTALGKEGEPV
jgi:hypothetical protein